MNKHDRNKHYRQEIISFLVIITVAVFFRFYGGHTISHQTVIGLISVAVLYVLVRHIFNWQTAAVSSYLLAISPWHVLFSKVEFNVIVLPFIATLSFYFLWKAIRHGEIAYFIFSGAIAGLGAFAGPAFIIIPLVAGATFVNYWYFIKSDFSWSNYTRLIKKAYLGFLTYLLALITVSPIISYWSLNALIPTPEKLGIELISWPLLIFFIVGFINELVHWIKKKHGHFSTAHTFILSWLIFTLLPLSEGALTYKSILAIPIISIFTAKGLLWVLDKASDWYRVRDPHYYTNKIRLDYEVGMIKIITVVIFLASLGLFEFNNLIR